MASRDGGPVMDPARAEPAQAPAGPSRRRLLTGAGLFGAGAVAGGLTGYFAGSATEPSGAGDTSLGQQTIPFYGAHQAGRRVPVDQRSPRHHVVDVGVAVDVGQPRACSATDEERRGANGLERADRTVHASREDSLSSLKQAGRACCCHG